jgi:hypothetical protein
LAKGRQSRRGQAVKTVSAVGVAEGSQVETTVGKRRSQAGIIVISDFVMKIKLHENG